MRKAIAVWLLCLLFSGIFAGVSFAEGLTGYYFHRAKKNAPVVTGPHDYKVIDKKIDFATATWDWTPFEMKEHFSVRWVGRIYIEKGGPYVFATFSDDGSSLFIGENKVVDNNSGFQEPRWVTGTIDLTPGYHEIEIVYYNWKGSSGMGLYWDTGNGMQIIPTEILFAEDFSRLER